MRLWKNSSWPQRIALVVAVAAGAAAVVLTARRDLAERDPSSIRGDAAVWRCVSYLPGGAAAYLVAGRKRAA